MKYAFRKSSRKNPPAKKRGRRGISAARAILFSLCLSGPVLAQPEVSPVPEADLSEVRVIGEALYEGKIEEPYLPDVYGTRIYSGKKTSVIDFDKMPQIQTDNYRQALSQTPGLIVSELSNPALLSLGSRGIGDPHETQNLLVTKDGIPYVSDLFGYPTVYYAPPFESIDRIEFIRGGASLLYGPQPAGVLNYVTHMPRRDRPWSLSIQQFWVGRAFFNLSRGGRDGGAAGLPGLFQPAVGREFSRTK